MSIKGGCDYRKLSLKLPLNTMYDYLIMCFFHFSYV